MNEILEMLQEIRPEFDFSSSDNFIEDELLDSFDVIALVDMFEKEFHIKIDALDILPENFTNINTMKDLINKNGGMI
jgi:acyl carrier protein